MFAYFTYFPFKSIDSLSSAGVTSSTAYASPGSSLTIVASFVRSWKCFLFTFSGLNSFRYRSVSSSDNAGGRNLSYDTC